MYLYTDDKHLTLQKPLLRSTSSYLPDYVIWLKLANVS